MQVNKLTIIVGVLSVFGIGFLLTSPDSPLGDATSPLLSDPNAGHTDTADPSSEEVLKRALSSATGVPEVHARRGLGVYYEREWRLQAAQTQLEAAVEQAAAAKERHLLAAVQVDLGRVLLKRGDLRGAALVLEEAGQQTGIKPGQVGVSAGDVWRARGDVAKAAGRYEEASSAYAAARKQAEDPDDVARINAAECDLLQLQRKLGAARVRCERSLARQTLGHPERPATLKTLGLIYYFGGEQKRALGLHTRAKEAYEALGNRVEAAWMREFAIDDESALLEDEDPSTLSPLIAELEQLLQDLLAAGEETLWWRVSDCQLRLADLYRKQRRFEAAENAVKEGLAAFQRRPAGWERVPDYATIFELQGLLARDQGRLKECREHLSKSLEVLEGIIGLSVDVTYLKEEIAGLDKEIAEQAAPLEASAL